MDFTLCLSMYCDRLAENLPGLGPRQGRRGFFKLSQEEKTAVELNKLNRKLKAKEKKIKRCDKVKRAAEEDKEDLRVKRKEFVEKIKADPQMKETVEVRDSHNMIV